MDVWRNNAQYGAKTDEVCTEAVPPKMRESAYHGEANSCAYAQFMPEAIHSS
jgi:hypothetical protein